MPIIVCPICGKQVSGEQREDLPCRPFCSLRCKQVDLGRWLTEHYVISEEGPTDRVVPVDEQRNEDGDEQ